MNNNLLVKLATKSFTQKIPAVCARPKKTILPPQAVPLPLQVRLNVSLTGYYPLKHLSQGRTLQKNIRYFKETTDIFTLFSK